MGFDMTLVRLRRALDERGGGVFSVSVERRDLKELLYHFDRLDENARANYHTADPHQECKLCKKQAAKVNRLVWLGIALGAGWFTFAVVTFP